MITLPARPESLTFAAQNSALIVVDMQNAYASQGGYLDLAGFDVSATRPVIDNINTAVAAARAAGMLIIWFQNGWDDQYMEAGGPGSPNYHKSNALKTMRRRPELQGKLLAKGGWDYQLVDELRPQPGDVVLPKPRYSGFYNTQLDSILRSRGIRHLVFTVSPPTSAWSRPCATASSSNISASCWRTPPIRPGRPSLSRRRCSILRPSLAGSATSPASAMPCSPPAPIPFPEEKRYA
nr:amidohydrolase RutB in pyrimidine catabolism pathway [Raoultella sp. NCTC 9187]